MRLFVFCFFLLFFVCVSKCDSRGILKYFSHLILLINIPFPFVSRRDISGNHAGKSFFGSVNYGWF